MKVYHDAQTKPHRANTEDLVCTQVANKEEWRPVFLQVQHAINCGNEWLLEPSVSKPSTIEVIALEISKHYLPFSRPEGTKATTECHVHPEGTLSRSARVHNNVRWDSWDSWKRCTLLTTACVYVTLPNLLLLHNGYFRREGLPIMRLWPFHRTLNRSCSTGQPVSPASARFLAQPNCPPPPAAWERNSHQNRACRRDDDSKTDQSCTKFKTLQKRNRELRHG